MTEKFYSDPLLGAVRLVKSNRAGRIGIRVHPHRNIVVTIPEALSYEEGLRFFLSRRSWAISATEKMKRRIKDAEAAGKAVPSVSDGTVLSTLMSKIVFTRAELPGCRLSVKVEPIEDVRRTGRLYLSMDEPLFLKTVHFPSEFPPAGSEELDILLRKVFADVLRAEAKLLLPEKLDMFASRYGFRYGRVAVKHNSSNWGSCSTLGNINLNINLLRVPEPLCDYVVLHELSHLKYPDHGPGFHDLLEKLCTDNIARLSGGKDPFVKKIISAVNLADRSRPVQTVMERELRKYRLF